MATLQPHTQAQQDENTSNFDQRVLAVDRVARVVKGGRRFRFRALVAVGDNKGKVGVGSSKGADVTAAINKAVDVAKKNMVTVPIEAGTIPHEITTKVAGAQIMLKPAKEGTGLIAGSVAREILESAGVNNIVSKSLGNNNKTNVAYAVISALDALVPKDKWIVSRDKTKASQGKDQKSKPGVKTAKSKKDKAK